LEPSKKLKLRANERSSISSVAEVPRRTCIRQHTSAYVSIRQHTSAYVSIRQHTSAVEGERQHTSAYVSIRQHTSAYASIRQHTSAYVTCSASHWRQKMLMSSCAL
jgi:isocitrate/isopropylmalate dehydrogenase